MIKIKKVNISGYNITRNPKYINSVFPLPPELEIQIQDLHKLSLEGKHSSIKKFNRLIEKYPNIPILKNYLSIVYQSMGNVDKANKVNRWLISEHPDYLFGKVNLAAECIDKGELNKVPEILGDNLELKTLFPERDIFHANEVLTFLNIAVRYFSAIGDLDEAETRLEIMEEIDENSKQVEDARNHLYYSKMKLVEKRYIEEQKTRITVKQKAKPKSRKTKHPKFTHSEINIFYEKDLTVISDEEIEQILSLPRESLINDLHTVLDDAIDRYNYFKKLDDEIGWDRNNFSFVLHAFFFLSELKATDSTKSILEILRQNSDFHEFYLCDLLTESVWEVLYKTSENNLDILQDFMCEPNIDTLAKNEVSCAVMQVYYNNPNRKYEVVNWYKNIFDVYSKSEPKDNIIDSELLGMIMSEIMDAQLKELIPSAKKLFDKNYVGIGICGNFNDFISEINYTISNKDYKKTQINIYQLYNQIRSWDSDLEDDTEDDDFFDDFNINSEDDDIYYTPPTSKQTTVVIKVGRNDPCPCGSGKKYKKCCLNN